jgi:hypothetical protein
LKALVSQVEWLKALVSGRGQSRQDAKRRRDRGELDGSIGLNRCFSVEGVQVGRCHDVVGERRGRPAGERKRHREECYMDDQLAR